MSNGNHVKPSLRGKLPMLLPQSCPICGKKVYLTGVMEWGADDGEISGVEYDCETEPDIDSSDWEGWFNGHYSMPYVDWLPWETKMLEWLNKNYRYDDNDDIRHHHGQEQECPGCDSCPDTDDDDDYDEDEP